MPLRSPAVAAIAPAVAAALIAALLAPAPAPAQTAVPPVSGPVTLKVGDPAPALTVGKWIKGGPVARFEPGKLYVVEFWATWCGPCKVAIPHLTELAHKHKDVTFIGQSVQEEDEADAPKFVAKMGDQMDYAVATDDTSKGGQGAMVTNWMDAAGRQSLPVTFLVDREGKIAWIGGPMDLGPVLEKAIAGTLDRRAEAERSDRLEALQVQLRTAMATRDLAAILRTTGELAALKPDEAATWAAFEFNLLARAGRADEARTRARTVIAKATSTDPLNVVAWTLATVGPPRPDDLALAREAADRANALGGPNPADLLDTSARVYAAAGDWDRAVAEQQSAIAKAGAEDAKAVLRKTLEAYQKHTLPTAE